MPNGWFTGRRETERAKQGCFGGKARQAWAWLSRASFDKTALSLSSTVGLSNLFCHSSPDHVSMGIPAKNSSVASQSF